jgi:tRNA nucleotidyltransferase (CCA-adding enzyme)
LFVQLAAEAAASCINVYNAFVDRIESLNLPACVEARSILDVRMTSQSRWPLHLSRPQGREVVKLLGANKPGAWTGRVLAKVLEWQLEYPDGTKEQCTAWLKAEHEAGRIQATDEGMTESPWKRTKATAGSTNKKAKR